MQKQDIEVWIYAFKLGRKVAYIGQTADPSTRERKHIRYKGSALKGCRFVPLFKTKPERAMREESELIQFYKSIGECWLNEKMRCAPVSRSGNAIIYEGVEFSSWAALSRHLDTTVQDLKERGIVPNVNGSGRFQWRPRKEKGAK